MNRTASEKPAGKEEKLRLAEAVGFCPRLVLRYTPPLVQAARPM
jgi:hypothetical protein